MIVHRTGAGLSATRQDERNSSRHHGNQAAGSRASRARRQRDILVREVHHRIKNNLQLITNAVKHTAPNSNESARVNVELQRLDTSASITIKNAVGTLPDGFDFELGTQVGTGLELVKLLLPPESSSFSIREQGRGVLAELRLDPPGWLPVRQNRSATSPISSTRRNLNEENQ